MEWNEVKQDLLKDKAIREAYEKTDLAYTIGIRVAEARAARGLTQAQLAELLDTKQPSIARLERGSYIPTLTFLQRVADALGTQLLPPQFESLNVNNLYSQPQLHSRPSYSQTAQNPTHFTNQAIKAFL